MPGLHTECEPRLVSAVRCRDVGGTYRGSDIGGAHIADVFDATLAPSRGRLLAYHPHLPLVLGGELDDAPLLGYRYLGMVAGSGGALGAQMRANGRCHDIKECRRGRCDAYFDGNGCVEDTVDGVRQRLDSQRVAEVRDEALSGWMRNWVDDRMDGSVSRCAMRPWGTGTHINGQVIWHVRLIVPMDEIH